MVIPSNMPPWSYSALTAYETCPRRYYLTRVAKEVVEPPTEATIWGNRVHSAIEDYIKSGKPIPTGMEKWGQMAEQFKGVKDGEVFAEMKLAITSDFIPTEWESSDAWCRSIVDAGVIRSTKISAVDWKTGKRKRDSTQLKLFAGMLFAHYKGVEVITTGFVWLKENKVDKERFTRNDIPEIWGEFLPRVGRLEHAYRDSAWEPRPSGLCKKWCPVGKHKCSFCGS